MEYVQVAIVLDELGRQKVVTYCIVVRLSHRGCVANYAKVLLSRYGRSAATRRRTTKAKGNVTKEKNLWQAY